MLSRTRVLVRLIAVLCCGLLLDSPAAWAHAALVDAEPAAGQVLEQAPQAITLTFNEPVSPVAVRLLDPGGQQVKLGSVRASGRHVHVALRSSVQSRGSYLLSWRVVSADGHPVGGVVDFAVGAASAQPAASHATGAAGLHPAIWLARWLTYVCVFGVAGAALFRAWNSGDRALWLRPLAVAGLLLLLLDLALQGLDLRGAGWSGLFSISAWSAALASSYAWTLGFLALALLLAWSAAGTALQVNRLLAAFAAPLLVAGALALSGHAATAPPRWLAQPAVALHVLMALAWTGSLLPLARALDPAAGSGRAGLRTLARFSSAITWVVALLVASGIVLASMQLIHPSELWRSGYGRVLLAKLALVALLLLVAAANRWRWTTPALAGSLPALRALRRAIILELLLAAAVLAVVALWRFTPPPRSLDAAAPGASAAAPAGLTAPVLLRGARVHATVAPARGATPWGITLQTAQGTSFAAQDVTLVLDNAQAGMDAMRLDAEPGAAGHWQVAVPPLPQVGHWEIALVVLVDDFDQIRLHAAAGGPPAHPGH